jgi:exonuclease III
MSLHKLSRRNKRGGTNKSASLKSAILLKISTNSVIHKLYNKMPKKIAGKVITDDLVAWFDDFSKTYYVGLHAKDYDGTDNMKQPFIQQMNAFSDWLINDVDPLDTVVLAGDLNTECEISPDNNHVLIYSNKDGKKTKIHQTFANRQIIKSSSDYSTTNKMRFMTAQLPKIYLAAKSKIDHVICFKPIDSHNIEVINPETKQIACESNKVAFRKKDCFQESKFPSDHDAVLFRNVATFNCCSSGASFDGNSLAHNTYEFFTDEMFTIFTEDENKKIVMRAYLTMLSELNKLGLFDPNGKNSIILEDSKFINDKGLLSKDIDIFSKSRGEVFDIHLHSAFVPNIVLIKVNGEITGFDFTHTEEQKKEQAAISDTDEKRTRYNIWEKAFNSFRKSGKKFTINKKEYTPDEYMINIGVSLLNVWHELLRNEMLKPHFDTWYDNAAQTHPRKTVVEFLFDSGATVVALQEIKPNDIDTVKKLISMKDKYLTIWNSRSKDDLSTVGCLITKV